MMLFFVLSIQSQSIVIGTGTDVTTTTASDPIDGYFNSFRYQVVYTAAELSASMTPADEITALGWSIAGDYGGGALLGYTIKIGHTSASNSATHDASPTTVVKGPFDYDPTVTAAGVFDMIAFDTNFVWNGIDNILVEVCSDGQNPFTSPYGEVRTTATTDGSRRYRVDGAAACGVDTNTANPNKPNIQFNYIEGTQPTDQLDYYNLQWPPTGDIAVGSTFNVYAQAYHAGLTDVTTGQAPGIVAYVGYSETNSNPSGAGWTWVPASFDSEQGNGNNDQYVLNLGSVISSTGTFYYATRWSLNGGSLTYGGIQADGSYGGVWGEDNNISGVLTINGPANDDCAGATLLTVEADLSCSNPVSGTTVAATESLTGCLGTANDDVWFAFEATGSSHVITVNNTGGNTDIVTQVFDSCGGESLVCQDTPNSPINLSGLTAGTTYYFRIYTYSSTVSITTNFTVCVGTPPAAPGNDECSAAVSLSCDSPLNGSTISATGGATTSCIGSIGNDVWYQFTGNDSTIDLNVLSSTTNEEAQVEVYSSTDGTCAGFTLATCFESEGSGENPVLLSFEAVAGTEYFIRVGNWINNNPGFDFSIEASCTPFPACGDPTNLAAIVAETTADISWTAPSIGTPTGYNWEVQPDGIAQGTAGGFTGNTTNTSDTVTGLMGTVAYDLFVQTDCDGDGVSEWVGPYSFTTSGPAPSNDMCADATSLTPALDFASGALGGQTQLYATGSGELPVPTCSSYDPVDPTGFGGDVWYSVVVPADGNIIIETQADPSDAGGDSGMSVYSGVCGALTQVDCDDDDGVGNFSLITIADPSLANQTLYIRVFEYGGNAQLNFQIAAWSGTLSIGEVNSENAFSYFPNPVKNELTLKAQSNIQNVIIYNMLGQEVLRTSPNTLESDVQMNELQSGAYFVKVTINNVTETIRVIKQ